MSDKREHDIVLERHFAAERERDAARAPAFAAMLDTARRHAAVADQATLTVDSGSKARRSAHRWTSRRVITWGAPLLVAAGLAIAVLRPDAAAEREFEALVAEWSRTSANLQHSPTDRLLSLPGSEYLRGTPSIGASRIRRPS